MKFLRQLFLSAGIFALVTLPVVGRADVNTNAPDFKEVYDLIRAHLAGANDSQLNRDAVQGLLQQLRSQVAIVGSQGAAEPGTQSKVLAKSALYDGPVAYLRIGRVEQGLANQIVTAYRQLNATNKLKGLVLDLRFADGHDYAEAAAVADLFVSKAAPLLDYGRGVMQSKSKSDAITLPIAVLINQETSAAAEALAAVLREQDRAVLIGTNTAGRAHMSQEFPLKDGQFLRIATAPIKLGNGQELSSQGIAPDIRVSVRPEAERVYFQDPFKDIPSNSGLIASLVGENAAATNRASHPRQINEAELMRERKANPGAELDGSAAPTTEKETEAEKPVIHDPVLGRGLDLVKGIAVVRRSHSS